MVRRASASARHATSTESVRKPLRNAGNVAELVVATEAAAVRARVAARRALAVRVFDVLPDALLRFRRAHTRAHAQAA